MNIISLTEPWNQSEISSPGSSDCVGLTVFLSAFPARKQASKNAPQLNLEWYFPPLLFLPLIHNVKCNLTYAIAALMALRLYRLMIIFLNANLSFGTKGYF